MNKIIVIGIDGATPHLLQHWIDLEDLPTFRKIRDAGCWGKLASTIPPFSAPAWTSIITGCNPGKHGIYGFESTGTLTPHLINSRYRKTPALWNYFSQIGLQNIIVNVPGTYPPDKINGVMITGLLTPSFDSPFTYPTSLKKRLHDKDLGQYTLEHFWLEDFSRARMKKHAPEKLLELINQQMQTRATVGLNLMKTMSWDFTMIVFRGTDTAQHFLFDRKDLLLQCYQKVDELIDSIMGSYPEATYVIVSDHGFEPIKRVLFPDNVLYNHGYLTPTWDPLQKYSSLIMSTIYRWIQKFFKLLPSSFLRNAPRLKQLLIASSTKDLLIDFSKTKAFSTADGRGLQICYKDKYPQGIVNLQETKKMEKDLKALFLSLIDPQTATPLVQKVFTAEDVYGNNAAGPPDLILSLAEEVTASEWIRYPQTLREFLSAPKKSLPVVFPKDAAGRSGDHAEYGIFYAMGQNLKQGFMIDSLTVEDILPVVFTIMNLPLPAEVTGKIPYDIFIQKPSLPQQSWDAYVHHSHSLTTSELQNIAKLRKKGL